MNPLTSFEFMTERWIRMVTRLNASKLIHKDADMGMLRIERLLETSINKVQGQRQRKNCEETCETRD